MILTNKMRWRPWPGGPSVREGKVCHRPSRSITAAFAIAVFVSGGHWASGQSSAAGEYPVKAAFLFHFAQFVDWPPETFKGADSPLVYCTIGGDPFHGALDASLSGKVIGGRPFRVQHFKRAREIQGCQVVFMGTAEKELVSAALANLKGNPVLTVGESEHFAQEGGMIGFCLEGNKVRFEINLNAAEQANLKISARLLALAKTVIGTPKGS